MCRQSPFLLYVSPRIVKRLHNLYSLPALTTVIMATSETKQEVSSAALDIISEITNVSSSNENTFVEFRGSKFSQESSTLHQARMAGNWEHDPHNPRDWPLCKKWTTIMIVSSSQNILILLPQLSCLPSGIFIYCNPNFCPRHDFTRASKFGWTIWYPWFDDFRDDAQHIPYRRRSWCMLFSLYIVDGLMQP